MLRSRFFWFVVGLLIGPMLLAPESPFGKQARELISKARSTSAVFLDTAGDGSSEISDFVSEE